MAQEDLPALLAPQLTAFFFCEKVDRKASISKIYSKNLHAVTPFETNLKVAE